MKTQQQATEKQVSCTTAGSVCLPFRVSAATEQSSREFAAYCSSCVIVRLPEVFT
jgi:hypothetical protein